MIKLIFMFRFKQVHVELQITFIWRKCAAKILQMSGEIPLAIERDNQEEQTFV